VLAQEDRIRRALGDDDPVPAADRAGRRGRGGDR